MKTQILQLEPHDDVISTRDKMGWGQAARIVLVWPKKERILLRRLDLQLLQRHAQQMGAQLALVTSDPDVRYNARQLAIPVFKNQRQAHSPRWRAGRRPFRSIQRRKPRPDLLALRQQLHPAQPAWYSQPLVRRGLHVLSLCAALALLALFLPGARIVLYPQTQLQEIQFNVSAGTSVRTVNVTGDLPAHQISIIVEGSDQIKTSGSVMVAEKASQGLVEFTNLTDERVSVPAGTVVTSLPEGSREPVRFSTSTSAQLSPGGTSLVKIVCLVAGKRGNLPVGEIRAIEGALGLKLSATNPTPTSGGSEQPAAAPTATDAQELFKRLVEALDKAALQELQKAARQQNGLPVEASLSMTSILEEVYTPRPDDGAFTQPAQHLNLQLRLEYQALLVADQDLQEISTRILDANLPQEFEPLPETLTFEHLSSPALDEALTARWRMVSRRQLQALVDAEQATRLARGLTLPQAKQILEDRLNISDVDIQLAPSWWPRLPWLAFRIQVTSVP